MSLKDRAVTAWRGDAELLNHAAVTLRVLWDVQFLLPGERPQDIRIIGNQVYVRVDGLYFVYWRGVVFGKRLRLVTRGGEGEQVDMPCANLSELGYCVLNGNPVKPEGWSRGLPLSIEAVMEVELGLPQGERKEA